MEMITYLTISANNKNINAIYILAEYFYSIKNILEMEKWYDIGISFGDVRCIINLAKYYKKNNIKIIKMIELFNEAAEKKSIYAMNDLADYYKNIGDIDLMIKYLRMSAELEYIDSYVLLASHYKNINDYDNMLLWLNKAINKGSVDAMINIGCYFRNIGDYNKMEEYFLMAFDKGDFSEFHHLLIEAENNKNITKLKKYLIIGIKKNDRISIDKTNVFLESFFDIELALICDINLTIPNKIKLHTFIINYHKIKNYEQLQSNETLNRNGICGLCKNEKFVLTVNPGLNFCHDCYENLKNKKKN